MAFVFVNSGVTGSGTRILTDRGEMAVEDLRLADIVLTLLDEAPSGETLLGPAMQPIIWIGHREVNCARHPKPGQVWPVRVASGAFGPGRPHNDLLLSPDHAVFVNGVLIPVNLLVNGTTIKRIPLNHAVYFHVELPRHAVILAEGLPVETYLDAGDRTNFHHAGDTIRLFPDFAARLAPETAPVWETHGAAPLVMTGPDLETARLVVLEYAPRRRSRRIVPPSHMG